LRLLIELSSLTSSFGELEYLSVGRHSWSDGKILPLPFVMIPL
jgi:hypothetical protein